MSALFADPATVHTIRLITALGGDPLDVRMVNAEQSLARLRPPKRLRAEPLARLQPFGPQTFQSAAGLALGTIQERSRSDGYAW